jgi:cytochrome c5
MSENRPQEAHSGPIKTPKQLLWYSIFAFVLPVFIIIGLVNYVSSLDKPAAGSSNLAQSVEQRIQKVGLVEIRDANRPLKAGSEVYQAQCAACHAQGLAGAPKFGDPIVWGSRLKTGFDALWNSALKGKGSMASQAGGDYSDVEIGRAVVHMANAAGAKFAEPTPATAEAK